MSGIGTSGSGIEYVSGVVTPDPAVAVHEYFTTGPATIDGVEYAAEQAVVLFRIQGTWVHKIVDLPKPPSVTLLASYEATGAATSTTFNFVGSGTVPEAGLLVACVSTHANPPTVRVGGLAVPKIVPEAGWDNPTPVMYAVAVEAGHGLDVEAVISFPRNWLAVDLLLVTGVDMVPYATVKPAPSSHNGAYAPDAPEGSIVLASFVTRKTDGSLVTTMEWTPPMVEATDRVFTGSYPSGDPRAGNTIEAGAAWGRHPGGGAFRLSPSPSELVARAVFRRAEA